MPSVRFRHRMLDPQICRWRRLKQEVMNWKKSLNPIWWKRDICWCCSTPSCQGLIWWWTCRTVKLSDFTLKQMRAKAAGCCSQTKIIWKLQVADDWNSAGQRNEKGRAESVEKSREVDVHFSSYPPLLLTDGGQMQGYELASQTVYPHNSPKKLNPSQKNWMREEFVWLDILPGT